MKEKIFLAASCLILAVAILVRFSPAAEAQHAITGPGVGAFMLVAHSNPNADAGVFKIDTTTGAVSYCYVSGVNRATVNCTGSVE